MAIVDDMLEPPRDEREHAEWRRWLLHVLQMELDVRARRVLELHLAGYTLQEIAKLEFLSQERVRQLLLNVEKKLREYHRYEGKLARLTRRKARAACIARSRHGRPVSSLSEARAEALPVEPSQPALQVHSADGELRLLRFKARLLSLQAALSAVARQAPGVQEGPVPSLRATWQQRDAARSAAETSSSRTMSTTAVRSAAPTSTSPTSRRRLGTSAAGRRTGRWVAGTSSS